MGQSQALTVADIPIAPNVKQSNQKVLLLNGVGIRKKFFFKVYVASLYLPQKRTTTSNILKQDEGRQIILNFIYSKVPKKKIVGAWNQGFNDNLSNQQKQTLATKIKQFNQMFGDLLAGNKVILDYQPNIGTQVTINGQKKGLISGKAFSDALLKIWIGQDPASDDLKDGLLGH